MTRVKVWEDKDHYIGEGELVGNATIAEAYKDIYHVSTTEEVAELHWKNMLYYMSSVIQEQLPSDLREMMKKEQCKNLEIKTTPKIILDSGKVVYGCQIWWEEI